MGSSTIILCRGLLAVQAKAGVCAAQLGDMEAAEAHLAGLQEVDVADMPDLFRDSAEALMEAGCHAQACPCRHSKAFICLGY